MGDFQDPKGFGIGQFNGPNTHPIGDSQDPTQKYPNVEFKGVRVHSIIAQIVGEPPKGQEQMISG